MEIKKVSVIGSGIMGHGIAEVFSISGFSVTLFDIVEEALARAKKSIESSVSKLEKSGRLKGISAQEALSKISYSMDLTEAVKDSDLIIEAVPESSDLKKKVISDVTSRCKSGAIIASNTSNIRITEIAEASPHPENVVGMHFFNPPVRMKLVEVIKGEKTGDEVFEDIVKITSAIGKTPVRVMKDSPGFVVNRISAPEALFFCLLIDKNVAKPEEIDAFAKSQGLPMGPYELMDFVGIDTVVHSLDYYAKELSPDYGKCKIFRKLAEENRLGLKSGEGFYKWEAGKALMPKANPTDKVQLLDIFALEVNEAVKLIEEGVATPDDIETGVRLGLNRPFGPISVAQGMTNKEIKDKLLSLQEMFGVSVFKPAASIESGHLRDAISGKLQVKQEKKEMKTEKSEKATEKTTGHVTVHRQEYVATVSISNGRLNLLNSDVLNELDKVISDLSSDREVRVVVIKGSGNVFSAGAELSQFVSGPVDFQLMSRRGQSVFKKLNEMPQLVIALIRGYAFGGGMELSLACDIRYSTPDAQFGQTEVLRGLVPGWGGTQRLARLVGFSRAASLILTGTKFTGEDARRFGIVSETFPDDQIEEKVMEIAKEISETASPSAVSIAKSLLYKGTETPLDDGLTMEAIGMGLLYGTDDLREGIAAFLQKRKPKFKGR